MKWACCWTLLLPFLMAMAPTPRAQPYRSLFPFVQLPLKRFSMNYMDLVDPNNPKSWQNTVGDSKPKKTAGNSGNSMEKRFSMNFLDTIGDQDPRSWQNTMTSGAGNKPRDTRSSDDQQSKRSRGIGGMGGFPLVPYHTATSSAGGDGFNVSQHRPLSALNILKIIEDLMAEVLTVQGPRALCENVVMRRLMHIKDFLLNSMSSQQRRLFDEQISVDCDRP